MANHEPGDKTRADMENQPLLPPEDVGSAAGAEEDPRKDDWRRAYAAGDRSIIVNKGPAGRAEGGYGFYGEHFGNTLYAPPVEFGGGYGGGHSAFNSTSDPFTNPARHGAAGYGYQGQEGWVFGKGGSTNVDHQRIAQCILLYKTEGVVQTLVHLLADFVVENIDIIHPDHTVHNFYQAWKTKVKLKDRLHRFVVDLLTTGNVFVWTKQAKLKAGDKQAMKRGLAAELIGDELVVELKDADGQRLRHKTIDVELEDDTFTQIQELNDACREHATAGRVNEVMLGSAEAGTRNDPADPRIKKKPGVEIPWGYISLNPLQMEPRGSRFANEHYWVMLLQSRDLRPLSKFMQYSHYTDIATTKVNLPEIFKGKLQPLQGGARRAGYAAELRLDESRLSVIHDVTKADYEDWATPQIYPAHKEVMFKRMLRQGEISAMESLKHMITLIKLGKAEDGFLPTEEQLERVAAALAGGGQTHHLVWDNLIEGQVLQPNIGNIFDPKKYAQVDKDIYASLGVSESVMAGKGSFANSFMSIKLLLEKLETVRNRLEDWLRVEIKHIADSMKFKRLPIIQWGLMNLRDENTERKLWLDLYDRGIVSDQSLLERFGTDFNIEKARQEIEKGFKEEKNKDILKDDKKFRAPVMVSRGPFNRDLVNKQSAQQKPPTKPGGRPAKTGTPQTKKRNTKPKGMSQVLDFGKHVAFAQEAIKIVSETATDMAVKTQSVRDVRSLSKAQKQDLEIIVLNTLGALDPNTEVNSDLVYKLLSDNSTEVFESEDCQRVIALYESEASNASTKEARFDLMCNAYAAIKANLLEDDDEATGHSEGTPEIS